MTSADKVVALLSHLDEREAESLLRLVERIVDGRPRVEPNACERAGCGLMPGHVHS